MQEHGGKLLAVFERLRAACWGVEDSWGDGEKIKKNQKSALFGGGGEGCTPIFGTD